MNASNMYYADPEKFDLSKMRAEAYRMSQGDTVNEPRDVVIHHHSYEAPCVAAKYDDTHETYSAKKEEEEEVQ